MRRIYDLSKLVKGNWYMLRRVSGLKGKVVEDIVQFQYAKPNGSEVTWTALYIIDLLGQKFRVNLITGSSSIHKLPALEDVLYNGGKNVHKHSKIKRSPRMPRVK